MFPIKRRSFITGGVALLALGADKSAKAQPAPSLTPHEKELYEAAKKEGGGNSPGTPRSPTTSRHKRSVAASSRSIPASR